MTLRSHKKHLTTASSTLSPALRCGGLIAGLALVVGAASLSAAEPPQSPVDRLNQRSPEGRWEHLKTEALRRRQLEQSQRPQSVPQPREISGAPSLPDVSAQRYGIRPVSGEVEPTYRETTSQAPVTESRGLKKVTSILPYADYQPDSQARTDIDPRLQAPEEVTLTAEGSMNRPMQSTCFQWQASDMHHNPLYFEDPAFERYGHTWHPAIQPVASIGRFTTQLVGLPYQMVIDPPCKKMYPLGWYRPGDCAPKQVPKIPWNTKAAVVQAGVVTGAFFVIP